jgi:ribonuclease P protein component
MSDEAHLPAEQSRAQTASRLSGPHGNRRGPQGPGGSALPRPQAAVGISQTGRALASISRRADFLAANRGFRAPTTGFVLLVRRREDGDPAMRLGITVTKKIGGAVVRNRMKRRFRMLARQVLAEAGMEGADHIMIGRAGGVERPFDRLIADLRSALAKFKR